ncbi:MAG: hypothetical protein V4484_18390 [Pseudomonadota bacterium]
MQTHKSFPTPALAHALFDEVDIGSGEKTTAQLETEALIREIPLLPPEEENALSDDADEAGDNVRAQREHDDSLERDEPSGDLDGLDPVPPKGR